MSGPGDGSHLAGIFRQEAERRLGSLAAAALDLESSGPTPELIAQMFRDAHTVKGAAGMMGYRPIAELAHAMEDVLEALGQDRIECDGHAVDVLLEAVDALRRVVEAQTDGGDAGTAGTEAEHALRGLLRRRTPAAPAAPAAPAPGSEPSAVEPAAPASATAPQNSPSAGPMQPAAAATIAVRVERLDDMARLVGECATAQLRLGQVLVGRGVDPLTVTEYRRLTRLLGELQQQAMGALTVPVATVTEMLQRTVRAVARETGKLVRWEVRGEDTDVDRNMLEHLTGALLHLVRNAVDHGLEDPTTRRAAGKPEEGTVRLHAMQLGSEIVLTVTDDGRGLDLAALRAKAGADPAEQADDAEAAYLAFRPGLSTAASVTEVSGRGVGLDEVRRGLERVRGRVEVRSTPGRGCEFRLIVPITLAVLPSLIVGAGGRRFALPLHSVVAVLGADVELLRSEGGRVAYLGASTVPVTTLADALGLPETGGGPVVVLAGLARRHGVQVEELHERREVVVKPLPAMVAAQDAVAGASVEPNGEVLLVLEAEGVIARARRRGPVPAPPSPTGSSRRSEILVVDDAMTVRELQRSILERAGYAVRTASDGLEALAMLRQAPADLVLTDVEMPGLDGFGLTEAIRADSALRGAAVLILTSLTDDGARNRGLEAGADGYLVKSSFDETTLLAAVARLLGDPE
ncbi:MAG: hybrid sensor histidine kinase/response regulator [Sporichthyaceae bacterium]